MLEDTKQQQVQVHARDVVKTTDQVGCLASESNESLLTLNPGVLLYYPSGNANAGKFNDSMILAINESDQSKQLPFTMFFTPNMEYAKRFSGLWSLNERPVYIHVYSVKKDKPITRIKEIKPQMVSNSLEEQICKNNINGIRIKYMSDNENIEEYYICNPILFFDYIETWKQSDSKEWIKITKENVQ